MGKRSRRKRGDPTGDDGSPPPGPTPEAEKRSAPEAMLDLVPTWRISGSPMLFRVFMFAYLGAQGLYLASVCDHVGPQCSRLQTLSGTAWMAHTLFFTALWFSAGVPTIEAILVIWGLFAAVGASILVPLLSIVFGRRWSAESLIDVPVANASWLMTVLGPAGVSVAYTWINRRYVVLVLHTHFQRLSRAGRRFTMVYLFSSPVVIVAYWVLFHRPLLLEMVEFSVWPGVGIVLVATFGIQFAIHFLLKWLGKTLAGPVRWETYGRAGIVLTISERQEIKPVVLV